LRGDDRRRWNGGRRLSSQLVEFLVQRIVQLGVCIGVRRAKRL
jgi:hypothetical protein